MTRDVLVFLVAGFALLLCLLQWLLDWRRELTREIRRRWLMARFDREVYARGWR